MIGEIRKSFEESLKKLDEYIEKIQEERERLVKEFEDKLEELKVFEIDKNALKDFLKEPYVLIPRKKDEYYVIVPKFIPMQIGWLEHQTASYNIFVINKYIQWIYDLPKAIKDKVKIPEPLPFKVIDGYLHTGSKLQEVAWERYKKFLYRKEGKDRIRIKKGYEFLLIAKLIEDGCLPFVPMPIEKEDLREFNKIKLRDYQKRAWKMFLKTGAIGVFWSFGAGKSVFGLYALGKIKGKKLVVVPTITLKEQWEKRTEKYLSEDRENIDIVTYLGYDKVKDNEYTLVVFDECLTGDTIVVLEDGGVKEIKNIKNDKVFEGGRTSFEFSRKTNLIYKIRSNFSILRTTHTHPHIIVRRKRDRHNNQWFKVNERDVRVCFAKDLKIGDLFLIPEKIPHTTKKNWTPEQLRFVGLIACDGHIEKGKNVIKVAIRKEGEIEWVRDVFIKGINSFGVKKYWEFTNKRGDYTIGCSSKRLKTILYEKFKIPEGKKANEIDISNEIFYSPLESIKAFIDACFSSEGWIMVEKNNTCRIYFSSTSLKFAHKFQLLLKKFGIHSWLTIKKRKGHHTVYNIHIGNQDFNKLMDLIKFSRKSLNIEKRNKGKFQNDKIIWKGKKYRLAKILEIKNEKIATDVYDFSTETHKFVANGCLTHNCHHLPANTYVKLSTIKAKYRIGLSGSPFREDGRENYIFALTGFPIGLNWEELIQQKVVAVPKFRLYVVKDYHEKMKRLEELLKIPIKTIIFCDAINLGKQISKRFGIPFVYGETKDRLSTIKDSDVVVVSRVGDEGISIGDIERVIEVAFLYGSRQQESQRFGRLMHSQKKEPEHIIIMTEKEFQTYQKRLYAIYERGFKIEIVR